MEPGRLAVSPTQTEGQGTDPMKQISAALVALAFLAGPAAAQDPGRLPETPGVNLTAEPHDTGIPITVDGTIEAGEECPSVKATDGVLYALLNFPGDFEPGDKVRVVGTKVTESYCVSPHTIDVDTMTAR